MLPEIQTVSGLWFSFDKPTTAMVSLHDVAHSLSCLNRYNGHAKRPYNVAQHSVLCSRRAPDELKLEALLHDAHEAYVGDMSSPLKTLIPEYRVISDRAERVVRLFFALPPMMTPEVKTIDLRMLVTEAKQFGFDWWGSHGVDPYPHIPTLEQPWSQQRSYIEFMNAYTAYADWGPR